jgi:solute carrier family 25 carnitine/acylcarnitine transporter 20/29
MQTAAADMLGGIAPLVFGAMSGCACWIPVYPVDVVKTLLQNTDGENGSVCAWDVVRDLYAEGGVGAFFDGLTPKMLRAAVNYAVTFWIYSFVMGFIAV